MLPPIKIPERQFPEGYLPIRATIIQKVRIVPSHIATPPSRGIGSLWILRSPGLSTKPLSRQYALTNGTKNNVKINDITKPNMFVCAVSKIVLSPINSDKAGI